MSVFNRPDIAGNYDAYYQTDFGQRIDEIEKKIISNLLKNVPRGYMLELGCGTGHWTSYFIKMGFTVIAVDVSRVMLELAEKKSLQAEFLLADAQSLPFRDETFSMISTIAMLEFVLNQEKVFQEIYRILKPGGRLMMGCLNANSVLGQEKDKDEIFKDANFLTLADLNEKMKRFGSPTLDQGVYLSSDYKILDDTSEKETVEPVFLAAVVQKSKFT